MISAAIPLNINNSNSDANNDEASTATATAQQHVAASSSTTSPQDSILPAPATRSLSTDAASPAAQPLVGTPPSSHDRIDASPHLQHMSSPEIMSKRREPQQCDMKQPPQQQDQIQMQVAQDEHEEIPRNRMGMSEGEPPPGSLSMSRSASNLALSADEVHSRGNEEDLSVLESALYQALMSGYRASLLRLFATSNSSSLASVLLTAAWSNRDRTFHFDPDIEPDALALLGPSLENVNAVQIATFLTEEQIAIDILDYLAKEAQVFDSKKILLTFLGQVWGLGNTTLHLASFLGLSRLVRRLLELGASANRKNERGYRPVDCADDDETRRLFLEIHTTTKPINDGIRKSISLDGLPSSEPKHWNISGLPAPMSAPSVRGSSTRVDLPIPMAGRREVRRVSLPPPSENMVADSAASDSIAMQGTGGAEGALAGSRKLSNMSGGPASSQGFIEPHSAEAAATQLSLESPPIRPKGKKRDCSVKFDVRSMVLESARAGDLDMIKAFSFASLKTFHTAARCLSTLHLSASYNHLPVVQYLIEHAGCDVNSTDGEGWTPLHCAAAEGHKEIVQYLVTVDGVNLDALNEDGEGVWDVIEVDDEEGEGLKAEIGHLLAAAWERKQAVVRGKEDEYGIGGMPLEDYRCSSAPETLQKAPGTENTKGLDSPSPEAPFIECRGREGISSNQGESGSSLSHSASGVGNTTDSEQLCIRAASTSLTPFPSNPTCLTAPLADPCPSNKRPSGLPNDLRPTERSNSHEIPGTPKLYRETSITQVLGGTGAAPAAMLTVSTSRGKQTDLAHADKDVEESETVLSPSTRALTHNEDQLIQSKGSQAEADSDGGSPGSPGPLLTPIPSDTSAPSMTAGQIQDTSEASRGPERASLNPIAAPEAQDRSSPAPLESAASQTPSGSGVSFGRDVQGPAAGATAKNTTPTSLAELSSERPTGPAVASVPEEGPSPVESVITSGNGRKLTRSVFSKLNHEKGDIDSESIAGSVRRFLSKFEALEQGTPRGKGSQDSASGLRPRSSSAFVSSGSRPQGPGLRERLLAARKQVQAQPRTSGQASCAREALARADGDKGREQNVDTDAGVRNEQIRPRCSSMRSAYGTASNFGEEAFRRKPERLPLEPVQSPPSPPPSPAMVGETIQRTNSLPIMKRRSAFRSSSSSPTRSPSSSSTPASPTAMVRNKKGHLLLSPRQSKGLEMASTFQGAPPPSSTTSLDRHPSSTSRKPRPHLVIKVVDSDSVLNTNRVRDIATQINQGRSPTFLEGQRQSLSPVSAVTPGAKRRAAVRLSPKRLSPDCSAPLGSLDSESSAADATSLSSPLGRTLSNTFLALADRSLVRTRLSKLDVLRSSNSPQLTPDSGGSASSLFKSKRTVSSSRASLVGGRSRFLATAERTLVDGGGSGHHGHHHHHHHHHHTNRHQPSFGSWKKEEEDGRPLGREEDACIRNGTCV